MRNYKGVVNKAHHCNYYMDNKEFTAKQVYILVFAIVVAIAFIETPHGAVWEWIFWKEFLPKVIIYGAVVEFVAILLASFSNKK